METRWLYTNTYDFDVLRKASDDVCVIPMGCIEKHSVHLALGTDILAASHIAYEASKIETFCVFPDFTFGDYYDASPLAPKGSVTISLDTQVQLLEEICDQIARNGYRKIIIYNGHGGNSATLGAFSRRYMNKKKNYIYAVMHTSTPTPHDMAEEIKKHGASAFPELTQEDIDLVMKYHETDMHLGHAGMSETAYMLGIAPESVHMERLGMENGLSRHVADHYSEAGLFIPNSWDLNYPDSYTGHDPVGCNERIGRATIRMDVERLVNAVRLLKKDELLWNHQQERLKNW